MSQIVSVRRVANNMLQAELTDIVKTSTSVNVLAKLNKGDDRFREGSLRHTWFAVTIASLMDLGIPKGTLDAIEKLGADEKVEFNFESPRIEGEELAIRVIERNEPFDDYQAANVKQSAKQLPITDKVAANKGMKTGFELKNYIGEIGYFMDAEGNHIFSRTQVTVKSQAQHTLLDSIFVPASQLKEYGAYLADKAKTEQGVAAKKF